MTKTAPLADIRFKYVELTCISVRVKGGMSLRNGMWHGLRNDIIMRNVKYGNWRKEIYYTERHACVIAAPFLAPI